MSYVFHDSPTRREHFLKETQATVFLLYFYTTRYLVFFSILNDSLQILLQCFMEISCRKYAPKASPRLLFNFAK